MQQLVPVFANYWLNADAEILGYSIPSNPNIVLPLEETECGQKYIPITNGTIVRGRVNTIDEIIDSTGIFSVPKAVGISINENGVIALVGSAEDLLLYKIRLSAKYNGNFMEVGIGVHEDKPLEWEFRPHDIITTSSWSRIASGSGITVVLSTNGETLRGLDNNETWVRGLLTIGAAGGGAMIFGNGLFVNMAAGGTLRVSGDLGISYDTIPSPSLGPGSGGVWFGMSYDDFENKFYLMASNSWGNEGFPLSVTDGNLPFNWTRISAAEISGARDVNFNGFDFHNGKGVLLATGRVTPFSYAFVRETPNSPWVEFDLPVFPGFNLVAVKTLGEVTMIMYRNVAASITRMVKTTNFNTFVHTDLISSSGAMAKGFGRFVFAGGVWLGNVSYITDHNFEWFPVYTPEPRHGFVDVTHTEKGFVATTGHGNMPTSNILTLNL
jgi:hypothetical protein